MGEAINTLPETVSPFEEITPRFDPVRDQQTDDLQTEHLRLKRQETAVQEMEALALQAMQEDLLQDPSGTEGSEPEASGVGAAAADVARGTTEAPLQVIGGVLDAGQEVGQMAGEFEEMLGMEGSPASVILKGLESAGELLPDAPEAETTTGGVIRTGARFLTGFAGAGKLKPIRALGQLGKTGKVSAEMVRGSVADFSVMDPHEERLADMAKELGIETEVTDFLASDPADTAAEGRFKNALEGLGLGGLTDAITHGARLVRSGRRAKVMAEDASAGALREVETVTKTQRGRFRDLVGDPDAPLVSVRTATKEEGDAAARALGEGSEATGDIFINFQRIDSHEDVKKALQKMADAHSGRIDEARRGGKRTFAQTKLDAEQVNAFDTLMQRRVGEPLNAEQSLAVRELWVQSGSHLLDLARVVRAEPGNDVASIAFRKQLAVHNAIQEQVVAARTETARALASWRIPAGDTLDFSAQMDELSAMVLSDDGSTSAIAQGILNLAEKGQLAEADSFLYGATLAKSAGVVRQLWYASLLSGPHTHARNIISQTAVIGQQIFERKLGNILGKVSGERNIPDGEASALMFGALQGFRDAFRIGAKGRSGFRQAWETGQSGIGVGKVDGQQPIGAIDPERWKVDRNTPWGKALSAIDAGTRMPTRALAASDEVFKSMGFRMELNASAYRKAFKELEAGEITSDQFKDRLATLVNNPDESMRLAARMNAEEVTFTKQPGRDAKVFNAMRAVQKVPVVGRMIMPFTRTPYNIANYAFQRTPLALVTKTFRDDLAAGGAKSDLAWSRFLSGTAAMMVVSDMTMRGEITGEGPVSHTERQTLMRTGWRPLSVKVGDKYFSYRGMEPVATLLGLSANITEILTHEDMDDENIAMDDVVIAAAMSIGQQMTSQQYMSGVSAFFEGMSDPRRYGESFFNRTASAVMPTGIAQLNRALMDPVARESFNALDSIKARTPFFSETLAVKPDLWGRPISYDSGFGPLYNVAVPIYGSRDTTEPIDAELLRLGAPMGRPPKRVTFDGVDVNLSLFPGSHSRYTILAGNELTHHPKTGVPIDPFSGKGAMESLNLLVTGQHPTSVIYNLRTDGSDGTKQAMIRSKMQKYREAAKIQLLEEFPEIRSRVQDAHQEQGKLTFQ